MAKFNLDALFDAIRAARIHKYKASDVHKANKAVNAGLLEQIALRNKLRADLKILNGALANDPDAPLSTLADVRRILQGADTSKITEAKNAISALEAQVGRTLTIADLKNLRLGRLEGLTLRNRKYAELLKNVQNNMSMIDLSKHMPGKLKHIKSELADQLHKLNLGIIDWSARSAKAVKPWADDLLAFKNGAIDTLKSAIVPTGILAGSSLLPDTGNSGAEERSADGSSKNVPSTIAAESVDGSSSKPRKSQKSEERSSSSNTDKDTTGRGYTIAAGLGGGLVAALAANKLADSYFKKHKTLATIGGGILGALAGGAAGNYIDRNRA